jgi:hypothetical protein
LAKSYLLMNYQYLPPGYCGIALHPMQQQIKQQAEDKEAAFS